MITGKREKREKREECRRCEKEVADEKMAGWENVRTGQTAPEEFKEPFKIKNRRQLVRNRIWAFAIDLRRISSVVIPWEIS